jgi:uncharacterized membrane protein SpoIIM required for sporulation
MVLESYLSLLFLKKKPFYVIPITFVYTSLALYFAHKIFPSEAPLFWLVLLTFLSIPLFWTIATSEKRLENKTKSYVKALFLDRSDKTIQFFIWFFLGTILAIALWYTLLPMDLVNELFNLQLNTIRTLNLSLSGSAVTRSFFLAILTNNIKVLILSVLFAFLFGPGAIFIVAWNASLVGVAIGNKIRFSTAQLYFPEQSTAVLHYTNTISTAVLRYLTHGIFEIFAYFIGILAGSLLSISVVNEPKTIRKTATDVIGLTLLAIGMLLISAVIEAYISVRLY